MKRPLMYIALCVAALFCAQPAAAFLEISTKAPYAVLMDVETGAVLYEKNPDTLMAPASMTKIATLSLLFEEIKQGRVKKSDKFYVSINAWKKGGSASGSSTMFLKPDSEVSVEDLIRGVIVQSGNDASITIAEALAGDEESFAKAMTRFARSIGLERTFFLNATGWPEEGHETTAFDLARLARHQIRNYPSFYPLYAERRFIWNGITQNNRNKLLFMDIGVDGLKTGHSSASGYGIVASAERRGRRLILVINGLNSDRARTSEARRLLDWGFRAFKTYRLFRAGDAVEFAPVWHGKLARVPLNVIEDITVTMTAQSRQDMRVQATYNSPVLAPIKRGQALGTLRVVDAKGRVIVEEPLVAGQDVRRLGFFGRAFNSLEHMLFGG